MQKVKIIEEELERKLTQREDDFFFMCNNLGFFVSQLDVSQVDDYQQDVSQLDIEELEYDVKIYFDYSYTEKPKEVCQGWQYFSGTLDKISSDIKEFSLSDLGCKVKRSRLL